MVSGEIVGEDGEGDETSQWILILDIILCIVGFLGNLLVLLAILLRKEYKNTVTKWYVLQLTIADLMFVCALPLKMKEKYDHKWPGPSWLCPLNESIQFLNYNSSIIFLTVMSIDRYFIICRTTSWVSLKLRNRASAYAVTVIVWAISIVLCTPIFMYSRVRNCQCKYEFVKYESEEAECMAAQNISNMEECHEYLTTCVLRLEIDDSLLKNYDDYGSIFGNTASTASYSSGDDPDYLITGSTASPNPKCISQKHSAWIAFVRFNFVALFLIPFTIMLICYTCIAKRMILSRNRKSSLTSSASFNERSRKERKRVTKSERMYKRTTRLCIGYIVLFVICWLPFHSVQMAKLSGIQQTEKFCNNLTSLAFLLMLANSCINPLLYCIMEKNILIRLRDALLSVKGRISSRADSNSSSSGYLSVRYRRSTKHTSSNSATVMTRIHKGKIESYDRTSGDLLQASGSG